MKSRSDGRSFDAPRPISIELGIQRNPEASVLYKCGGTTVLIAASIESRVPDWMRDSGRGWITAEYEMHTRANPQRRRRSRNGKVDGRTQEIQRLISRSLRAAVDLKKIGERMITIDCDILDADGGTRTASVTGGCIALAITLDGLRKRGLVTPGCLREMVAAISVGLVDGGPLLDLCYEEDRDAEVDLNVVGTAGGDFVEVQGTAEGAPVKRAMLNQMIDIGLGAMPEIVKAQHDALKRAGVDVARLKA